MMRTCTRLLAGVLVLGVCSTAVAQTLELYAGGEVFENMPALEAGVMPESLAVTPDGRVYVTNAVDGKLLRFDPASGTISQVLRPELPGTVWPGSSVRVGNTGNIYVAGIVHIQRVDVVNGQHVAVNGVVGTPNCNSTPPASWARFQELGKLALGPSGQIFAPDLVGNMVCSISATGSSVRYAGIIGTGGFAGDGGPAINARLNRPAAVAADGSGNLYISDSLNHRIRKVAASNQFISTIAGTGQTAYNGDGIAATAANISSPGALAADPFGNVYVYDTGNQRLRRIDSTTGIITTIAGTESGIGLVTDIAIAWNGDIYLADKGNRHVRRIDASTGVITTLVGNGSYAFCGEGALATDACLWEPLGLAMDAQQNLVFADASNQRIRKVDRTTRVITTIAGGGSVSGQAGDGGLATAAALDHSSGVAFDHAGNLFIAGGHRIRRVDAANGIITTVAGNGTFGYLGEGTPASQAQLGNPTDLAFDSTGNLYIADTNNNRIRRVDAATGFITTIAGGGVSGTVGDGGNALAASLNQPRALAFDRDGNLLFVDTFNYRLRKIDLDTMIITTIAGTGVNSLTGDGGPATSAAIGLPTGVTVDSEGHVYFGSNARLRRIDAATGIVTTVAGDGFGPQDQHGQTLPSATRMVVDANDDIFISASGLKKVYRLSADPPPPPQDTTPPEISWSASMGGFQAGWYRGFVHSQWHVSDPESPVTSSSGCDDASITTDTAGLTLTCTATSAGGTRSYSTTIRLDSTPPSVDFGAQSPAATASGWNNSDVSTPFTPSDAMSGVFSVSTSSPLAFTGEGAGITRTVTVTDVAGNSASYSQAVNIDRTPPLLALTTPAEGASYVANTVVPAQYACSDALSGIASCAGTVPNGSSLPTQTAGTQAFQVQATDAAGNVANVSRNYTVTGAVGPMTFEGWTELRRPPKHNAVPAGRLVPIRWRLRNSSGQVITNPAAFQSISVLPFTCQMGPTPFNAIGTGAPGLSVDASTGIFTYNWQTEPGSTGCRRVQVRFADNSMQELIFMFQ